MKKIINIVRSLLPHENFDALGVGIIDFKARSYEALEFTQFNRELILKSEPTFYYDLASVSKPITNALSYFLRPDAFDEKMLLALNHRGGIPAWGLLPNPGWKEQVLSYPIHESETLYSDFSALRVMLELEKKGINQKNLCQTVWDKETMNWLDLPFWFPTLQYGYKQGRPNFGAVHDPNAYVINEFCSHAGQFSTVDGLCRTLLNYESVTGFIKKIQEDLARHNHRYSYGWKRWDDSAPVLAGPGCSEFTFGHLGFTGTSVWIDPEKMRAHVILSNATKYFWYDKKGLNDIRCAIGEEVWKA